MKQTAVEWLLQRFEDGDMYNVEDTQFIKHQALAMEKEQMIDMVYQIKHYTYFPEYTNHTQDQLVDKYYNETYGK